LIQAYAENIGDEEDMVGLGRCSKFGPGGSLRCDRFEELYGAFGLGRRETKLCKSDPMPMDATIWLLGPLDACSMI
jgi:hypothetical protein